MGEARGSRWLALDVLRGAAVAMMIVVTSPGDWNQTYAPLRHADWNGWTVTDMVFPTFLFAVGVALAWSFPRRLDDPGERRAIWGRVARRVLALIALGLALNLAMEVKDGLWYHDPGTGTLAHVRIPGVLQRIALSYLAAAALLLWTARPAADGQREVNWRMVAAAALAALVVYWALLRFVPVPGFGTYHLEPEGSLTGAIDMAVFTPPHMWRLGSAEWGGPVTYDPEGLLSTITATANVLFGVLAGFAFRRFPDRAPLWVAGAGAVLFALGWLLDPVFVINKRLWTSSFALLSSGFSAMLLVVLVLLLRGGIAKKLAWPLIVLGGNAVLGYSLSILLGVVGGIPLIPGDGKLLQPQEWGNTVALGNFSDPQIASLACALAILTLIVLILWPLHRKGIHLRL